MTPQEYQKYWADVDRRVNDFLESRGIEYPPFGFDVGPGWLPHVFAALDALIAAGWDKKLGQVKQKFCGLRIYLDSYEFTKEQDDAWQDIILIAESKCEKACEYCGLPHGLTIPRSGVALCPNCEEYNE